MGETTTCEDYYDVLTIIGMVSGTSILIVSYQGAKYMQILVTGP
jgi:hypothetical protein